MEKKGKKPIGITLRIGMPMRFTPAHTPGQDDKEKGKRKPTVVGKVVYINTAHRYFTLEYKCGENNLRESRNFFDVGRDVFPC